jgi:hypothetical protein
LSGTHAFHAYRLLDKKVAEIGAWHDGKMPKTGPNTVNLKRPLRFGTGFRWCLLRVESAPAEFRILVSYHSGKRNFSAFLFQKVGLENLMLARLENHSTHPGVHLHACCSETSASALGRTKYDGIIRCPATGSHHRSHTCPDNDVDALDLTGLHFNLPQLRRPKPAQFLLDL